MREESRDTSTGIATQAPQPTLPKGGGAIRGLGEKFSANPVTGTGSMSVPVFISPGRGGFNPEITLSYDSGNGNGPFGFGWHLSIPMVSRKTDKGLPLYNDQQDTFLLSNAEDLVPIFRQDETRKWLQDSQGHFIPEEELIENHRVLRFRPRIESLFARIEQWIPINNPANVHWRSITKDNILNIYGLNENSRVADPEDSSRIFSWFICETRDDKGNAILYNYKGENGDNVDLTKAHEQHRGLPEDVRRTANRYIKSILYGNQDSLLNNHGERPHFLVPEQMQSAQWMFEAVFDYGEHNTPAPTPTEEKLWDFRPDPFSAYRSGFEVRTTRLCQRILMFHHFSDENEVGTNCLVKSTDFTYVYELDPGEQSRFVYSFLSSSTQTGYKRLSQNAYLSKSLPPLEFEYSRPQLQDQVQTLELDSLENLPIGLDSRSYDWVDLHGEGTPGILSEQAGAWYYKRNLSPSNTNVCFSQTEQVSLKPNALLVREHGRFMDLAGDGTTDFVLLEGPTPGFFEHDDKEGWRVFTPFAQRPNRNFNDKNVKFVDLNGDGHTDILITEDDAFLWHSSLGENGFSDARRVPFSVEENQGPRIVFADSTESIHLADISGDGLSDIVRIRNGEICYWPNLGYGRFGAKVIMDAAPLFDHPDQFDSKRLRLADIDGSGTTDILYLHRDGVQIYFNQSGNSWSPTQTLPAFPHIDDMKSILPVDLRGNGTLCLVWSSSFEGDAGRHLRYVDLMGGTKPHLLTRTSNNLGSETRIHYAPSTKFYLQDRINGKPWLTKLPFAVHVVEKVETFDHISRNRFATRYAYHHGHFDGVEREFRGFGFVEQWDTENIAALNHSDHFPSGENIDATSYVPPVYTKTWFHTGALSARGPLLNEDQKQLLRGTSLVPKNLTAEEERQAFRSLKGSMLRQEVYSLDGTEKEQHPYTVTEQTFKTEILQPRGQNKHAVFWAHSCESLACHYERNTLDPRIQHSANIATDIFGNITENLSVSYGRLRSHVDSQWLLQDREKQQRLYIIYTAHSLTKALLKNTGVYRTPLPAESRTYEIHNPIQETTPGSTPHIFSFEELVEIVRNSANDNAKNLLSHTLTLYRPDDFGLSLNSPQSLLPLGIAESLAIPGENYKLALTSSLLDQAFQKNGQPLLPNPVDILKVQEDSAMDRGGYVDLFQDGRWWASSGRVFFSASSEDNAYEEFTFARNHFFQPHRFRNSFHTKAISTETQISYDKYHLLVEESRDALGNTVTVGERSVDGKLLKSGNNYRVLQPQLIMDPNRCREEVRYDVLGMVVGTASMGKPEESQGDSLEGFIADLDDSVLKNHLQNPLATPNSFLGPATTRVAYDLFSYYRTKQDPSPQPCVAYTLARETHGSDLQEGQLETFQHSFTYSDGFGREIQRKVPVEAGPVLADGPDVSERWVTSGWTIFNNKGNPVQKYEPFFSTHPRFEFGVKVGVSSTLFYDPLQRVVATIHPNNTYEKVLFSPWKQESWDVQDTVLDSPRTDADISVLTQKYFTALESTGEPWKTWYEHRSDGSLGTHEKNAALKAAAHAKTPSTSHMDSLGHVFLKWAHNGFDENNKPLLYATRTEYDIQGRALSLRDAMELSGDKQGRIVMRYVYDFLNNVLVKTSMEAGTRWVLNDVSGKPIRMWDERGHTFRTTYDPLRRPLQTFVTGALVANPQKEVLTEILIYGEQHPEAELRNLHRKVYMHLDQAGAVTVEACDFKQNPLRGHRRIAKEYKQVVDWSQVSSVLPELSIQTFSPLELENTLGSYLEVETYHNSTTYDAINRPVIVALPHADGSSPSTLRVYYNESRLLERIEANLRGELQNGSPFWTPFVTNINYDAKGLRTRINYGNGVTTRYTYDPLTSRLVHLLSTRPPRQFPEDCPKPALENWPGCQIQNLHYTYDPIGNITHIQDDAQQTAYFRNKRIDPSNDYTYDALYRLIQATGREHLGTSGSAPSPHSMTDADRMLVSASPYDGNALGTYIEEYVYDAVGNFLKMHHRGTSPAHPGWTRHYNYVEVSQIENGTGNTFIKTNNRLTSTTWGSNINPTVEKYKYDEYGNMTDMPSLDGGQSGANMRWDFRNRLCQIHLGGGGTAYYVYDYNGQRVRKVWEKSASRIEERIYLGGVEIFRQKSGNQKLERETIHIMDGQQRIALVESRTVDTDGRDEAPAKLLRYQLSNHQSSCGIELDSQAKIISYEEYTPYGSTSFQAVRSQTETAKRYRYTGQEREEESGLYYQSARYYAPWLGRWTAADPAKSQEGNNRYEYCYNNPVRFTDPSGRQPPPEQQAASGMSAEQKAAWADAEAHEYDGDSVGALISVIERERAARDQSLLTRATVLEYATVRASAAGYHINNGNYGRAFAHGTLAVVESFGYAAFGDTPAETAKNAVVGALFGWAFGKLARAGRASTESMKASREALAKRVADRKAASTPPPAEPPPAAPKPPPLPPLGVRLTDNQLVARAVEIFEKAAAAYLRSKGQNPTPKAIASMKKQMTVGVLQGETASGEVITTVTVQDPKFASFVRALLTATEEMVEPVIARKLHFRNGTPNKTGYITVHAEQNLAGEAVSEGLRSIRVATSNPGCQAMCIPTLREFYPAVTHVNPGKP